MKEPFVLKNGLVFNKRLGNITDSRGWRCFLPEDEISYQGVIWWTIMAFGYWEMFIRHDEIKS